MSDHPIVTFRTIALAALLVWPSTAMAVSGLEPADRGLAGTADPVVHVAQYQVLDTETGEGNVPGGDAEAVETLDGSASDVEEQGSVFVVEAEAGIFTWQAQKDGQDIVFTGFVPSTAAQSLLAVTTGGDIQDDTEVGAGAPDGFLVDALSGIDALAALESGTLRYQDDAWSLEGSLAPGRDRSDLEESLKRAATPSDAWTLEAAPPQDDGEAAPVEQIAQPVADEPRDTAEAGDLAEPASAAESATVQTEPAVAAPDPEYRFSALKGADGSLTVQGDVPDPSTLALVARLAGEAGQGDLTVNPRAPQDFVSALYAGLAALDRLDQGQLAFANGNWLLSGRAAIDTQKNEALAVLSRLGGAERFRTMVTAPPASAVCRAEVTAFMANKSILFASGSANLTPESRTLLPDIAQLLKICPQTTVYVEGHTDSDGGEALNLPLSVARAEAVVDELIALGVLADRLYAVGYGSSLPVASNDTAQGKRQNRRIAFTFEDTAQ